MYTKLSIVIFSILVCFMVGFSPKSSAPRATPDIASRFDVMVAIHSATALRNQPVPQSPIRISAKIPTPPESMSLYELKTNRTPVDFLNEKLEKVKLPALRLDKKRYAVFSGFGEKESLHAFIDMRSGDTEFIPNLADVVKTAGNLKPIDSARLVTLARAALNDERFIPKDATDLQLAEPIRILGGANTRSRSKGKPGETRKQPALMMTIVPAVRYAGGFKVYGLGSHAVVTLNNEGSIIGLMRRWRMASVTERIKPVITVEKVHSEILRQLQPLTRSKGTQAVVDKVEIAYYDNNKALLQPVYHFEATIEPSNKRISPIRVSGFIPIAKLREPIPDLTSKTDGAVPRKAITPNPKLPHNGIGSKPTPDDITLGEYCNRDWHNDNGYISMSYAFLHGLTSLNSIFPGWTPPVTRTQWYEAWPWEVVGPNSKSYMNAVNVAYTVPHGDWLINSTLSNCCDLWDVSNIGTGGNPGFGAGAGGKLATWVIMSCEVIPSYYDRANERNGSNNGFDAFNAWWGVFQGLHNAIGFRTIMFYPDNDTNWAFGWVASTGCDVNAAWFQEVAAYHSSDGSYKSQHLKDSIAVHYDRASTMIDGRNLGQSIFSVGAQSPSGTLWNFWMSN